MAAASTSSLDLSAALVLTPVPALDWMVILPPVWCILAGATLLMLRRRVRLQGGLAIAALVGLVFLDMALLGHVVETGSVTMVMGRWLPPFGIAFTVDLTGALFALTAAILALAGALYALDDVNDSGRRYGFYPMLLMLMAGVTGAFLTGDIFNLYVWFEVLLIASFGLIVLGSGREQIDGAVKYGFLNLVATTLFLVTTALLYGIFGTLNMADIARKASALSDIAPLVTLTALFLLAFGMKAAAFPLNSWLPASYHTPRIVVSALFAGLLTKVGIYALLRTTVMLFPLQREALSPMIAVVAVLTMLTGGLGALAQTDMRRTLGYLVISGIGSMLAGLALAGLALGGQASGGAEAVAGTIVYALHSMVVMTALYFAIGLAARSAGGFSITTVAGLYRRAPFLSALSLILFFSVSGLPPFSGFWPKVMLVEAALGSGAWILATALLLTGFLTTIATGRLFLLAYWRPAGNEAAAHSPLPPASVTALTVLTAITVLAGIYPEPVLALARTAADTLTDPTAYIRSVFPEGAP